jgi:hypothetical protein
MDSLLDFLSRPYAGFATVFGFLLVLSLLWFAIGKLFLASRVRRLYLVILFILNLTVAYWVIMEGYFRFVYNESDSRSTLQTHKMWERKNVKFNDFRLRDDIDYGPLRWKRNVVLLVGDSIQWGQGIEFKDTVTSRLRRSAPEYEFLNISSPGWSTLVQLLRVENIMTSGFVPKIFILNYYMNDIDSYEDIARAAFGMKGTRRIHSLRFSYSAQNAYSRLGNYLSKGVNNYASLLASTYDGPSFLRHKNTLRRLITYARMSGAKVLVVVWPALPVQEEALDELNSKRKLVIKVIEDEGIDYIDLYPRLLDLDRRSQTANKFDVHPSAAVHGIAAEVIAGRILETNKSEHWPRAGK